MNNTKNYISVNLCGGLGNQLFQIACVYSLAYEYDLIPIIKMIDSSPSIFKNRSVYFDNLFKKININNESEYNKIDFIKIKEKFAGYDKIIIEKNKSYLLDGYFQSPKYFKTCLSKIMDILNYDEKIINDYYLTIKQNYKNTVSLHIRRGDYLQIQNFHPIQQIEYYIKAMNYFDHNETLFVVFSDDIEWCKNNLSIQNVYFIEKIPTSDTPQDVFELFLMSLCDNNIIANSSFSSWAAYLNKNPNKKVIAPFRWFVPDKENNDIKDIYDDDWIII